MENTNSGVSKKKIILYSLLAVFILLIIKIGSDPSPADMQQEVTSAQTKPLTLEDKIQSLTSNTRTTEVTYKGMEDEKADPNRPVGSRMVTVKFNISSFYDSDSLYRDTGNLTGKVFQETYASSSNIYDVIVWYYGDTKDRYGNVKNDVMLSYAIDKKTYQKINWSNFNSASLCDFLKSEGTLNGGETACTALANIQ